MSALSLASHSLTEAERAEKRAKRKQKGERNEGRKAALKEAEEGWERDQTAKGRAAVAAPVTV